MSIDSSQVKNFLLFVEIDAQVNEFEDDKTLVNTLFDKAHHLIDNYQAQIKQNNIILSTLIKKQHATELELKTINAQEIDKKLKLDRVSNSKEFNAVYNELGDLEKRKKAIEEDYLNGWQELEGLERELADTNKHLELNISTVSDEINNLRRRMASLENQLKDAIVERDKAIKAVDPELLNQYNVMKQSTKNPVVKAKRESCGGCFYLLSPQDLASLEQHKLIRCKNCYRIVYNPEEQVDSTT